MDSDPVKVADARKAGHDAVAMDVLAFDPGRRLRFVTMVQLLEHLPDLGTVERVIGRAAELATDFIYIHHPSFEDEDYLESLGLKLYYHDWPAHQCHVRRCQFVDMFERFSLQRYYFRGLEPVHHSSHPSILPSGAPQDSHQYDQSRHGPKPAIRFPRPIYQHVEIFGALREFTDEEWADLIKPYDMSRIEALQTAPPIASMGGEQVALFDCEEHTYFLAASGAPGRIATVFPFGPGSRRVIPVAGDWDGDGTDTVGVYDQESGQFHLANRPQVPTAEIIFGFGPRDTGWQPIAGDWNGDGKDTVGLYAPETSKFYLTNTLEAGNAEIVVRYGSSHCGWIPLAGDWNAAGADSVGLYCPDTSAFHLRTELSGEDGALVVRLGSQGKHFIPLAGDWDGDGRDGIGLYDPHHARFYITNRLADGEAEAQFSLPVSGADLRPVAGNWGLGS